jgi:putative transcriptional regulator
MASASYEPLPGFARSAGGSDPSAPALAPGIVLVAAPDNFDHYLCESLVLLLEHDGERGSRGVLLNHETPWSVTEMNDALTPFDQNLVFLGGDRGADTMLMLHADASLPGAAPVGAGGLHRGGLAAASARVAGGSSSASAFKFFYRVSEWLPGMLDREVADGLWSPVELPLQQLLQPKGPKSMWQRVRDEKLMPRPRVAGDATMPRREPPPVPPKAASPPATTATAAPAAVTAAAAPSAPAGPGAASAVDSGSAGAVGAVGAAAGAGGKVAAVVGFRRFMGNEQWRVRWRGFGASDDTWEAWRVLEAEAADETIAEAGRLRDEAGGA